MRTTMNDTKESLKLREIFLRLAWLFTENQADLSVEINQAGKLVTLSPKAHCDDAAKLIGGGGANFRAMINVLSAAATKIGVSFYLAKVKDIRGSVAGPKPPKTSRKDWPKEVVMNAFRLTCADIFRRPFEVEYSHQPDDTTIIELTVEDVDFNAALGDGLSILFCAIGFSNGREIKVEMQKKEVCAHENLSHRR